MEPDDLKTRFTPKWLDKRIPGQRLFPTCELRPFEYGAFEQVYPMKFEFVYHFGGYSGALLQTPGEGLAWIKSVGIEPYFYQVLKKDLNGNYRELEETR